MLPVKIEGPTYKRSKDEIPQVSVSASRNDKGVIHVSLCNLDHLRPATMTVILHGAALKSVSGRLLTARAMNAHNTFTKPETIQPVAFTGMRLERGKLLATLPAKSVVVLALK